MTILLQTPSVEGLSKAINVLRAWQYEGAPMQLHPGDVGWFWRFGLKATAAALRTWSRDGQIVAIGLLDDPKLLRLTLAPDLLEEDTLSRQILRDLTEPERGILPSGHVDIEIPRGALLREMLTSDGWHDGEPWTPLHRDLAQPVADPGLRIEVVGPDHVPERTTVQREAFEVSTFTEERWQAMASGIPYADARCLVAYDHNGNAVATVTVWSAGVGKPGLIEPMGTHRDYRGHGYGSAITVAAAAVLQEMGSSSAIVCTPASNVAGTATYRAAGFQELPKVCDKSRLGA